MSVTDQYALNDVIYRVLENGNADAAYPTLLTNMFTSTELADSMNRVQQAFLLATGMILTQTSIPQVVGLNQYALPVDCIRPRRLLEITGPPGTFVGYGQMPYGLGPYGLGLVLPGATAKVLTQADTWELDTAINSWPFDTGTPITWWETTLTQQRLGIAPTPDDVGNLGLLYVALAALLTGLGVNLTIPDDFTPYLVWGTLAELLSSDGPTYDPVRADYCKRRYDEGVELANLVLKG